MARFPNHEGLGFSDRDLGPLCLEWGLGVNCSITIYGDSRGFQGVVLQSIPISIA